MTHFKKMQDELLLCKLSEYFSKPDKIEKIMPIIKKSSKITLTLLDWFVANYTKYVAVEYQYEGRIIDVNREYSLQLREYTKKMSDPFCRDGKFNFYYNENDFIETSVKQLCFFRWALNCGIIDYVEANATFLLRAYKQFKKNGGKLTPPDTTSIPKNAIAKKNNDLPKPKKQQPVTIVPSTPKITPLVAKSAKRAATTGTTAITARPYPAYSNQITAVSKRKSSSKIVRKTNTTQTFGDLKIRW